ncbi:MAG: T9SS type A sorting domain-containing protein [Bacteroidota bacterium]
MKQIVTLVTVSMLILLAGASAQAPLRPGFLPLKDLSSPVYGTDVIMHDDPAQDQNNAAISVAMNGWIYTCYSVPTGGYYLLLSNDDGRTWTSSSLIWPLYTITHLDIIATGSTPSGLRIYVAFTGYDTGTPSSWFADVDSFNSDFSGQSTFVIDYMTGNYGYGDIKIASDFRFPGIGTSPFGLGIILTRNENSISRALYIYSMDAGHTYITREIYSSSYKFLRKATIAYGLGATNNAGRFYLAFESLNSLSDMAGDVFMAFTASSINSSLNLYVPFATSTYRNPSMVCQANLTNNSAGEFTVILFAEFFENSTGISMLGGIFNTTPVANPYDYSTFTPATSSGNTTEADASFDPAYNNFLLTYFDIGSQQLNYMVHEQNMANPDSWNMIRTGYNDQPTLTAPWPKVRINPLRLQVAHVWIANPSANGVALFDAEYSTVGMPENLEPASLKLTVNPNPVSHTAKISFAMARPGDATVKFVNINGQTVFIKTFNSLPAGITAEAVDLSSLPTGVYFCSLSTGSSSARCKVLKQ